MDYDDCRKECDRLWSSPKCIAELSSSSPAHHVILWYVELNSLPADCRIALGPDLELRVSV